ITLDNASNNDTMMRELERLLCRDGIPFHHEGNRIRPSRARTSPDPVARCRTLVRSCRISWARRRDLRQTIILTMESKQLELEGQNEPESSQEPAKPKELLRDVDTRWSALFMMIDRLLELYEAIDALLNAQKQKDIRKHALDEMELRVLADIREFLYVFHCVQELLSSNKTPTLPLSIPMYKSLMELLRMLRGRLPMLENAINASLGRLRKYLSRARRSKAYALAMILHLEYKFTWIDKYWTAEEAADARRWLQEAVS
ncbi:uncharacterized protein PHACADRAFT_103191, partial [Phanerochaete carnosa HHB-10118-sp]